MADLKQAFRTIVDSDNPAALLIWADEEMQKIPRQGDMYELSRNYAWMQPVLEFYTYDLEGWVKFVRKVRDKMERRSKNHMETAAFSKMLLIRSIQRRTRAILDVAVNMAVRKGLIPDERMAKERYQKRCVQSWKQRRDNLLKMVRASSKTKRISRDELETVVADFWETVASEVNNGEVPKP